MMKTIRTRPETKAVIVEIADVFLNQSKFEEIPDETLQPDEYKDWEDTEHEARESLFDKIIQEGKKQGFTRITIRDWEYCKKHGIDLGLNGMYIIMMAKPDTSLVKQASALIEKASLLKSKMDFADFANGLILENYSVYYFKHPEVIVRAYGDYKPKTIEEIEANYIQVAKVKARLTPRGLHDVYAMMQGEKWSPKGKAKDIIKGLGLQHTSMSVGDLIFATKSAEWFIVKPAGFEKVDT